MILLYGTGRAATHLGHAFVNAGVKLVGVVGRNEEGRTALAKALGTAAYAKHDVLPKADLILLAVADDAIEQVAAKLSPSDAVVAHCSGARSLDALEPHANRGVVWPIQTLGTGEPIDLTTTPLVIDGNTDHARTVLQELAKKVSSNVVELAYEKRQRVHLAAVLTSNLPVFLVREGQRMLRDADLPTTLLEPLWQATAERISELGPEAALTGPARRGDIRTVKQHLDQLADDPDLRDAYALLSKLIMRTYGF
ncbi:MAG: Rossmann-like and DUF2520 domain-containing protein [Flavobacteriales bacterium]|jgi:predicted short-subunit dehydrogenase-like oxidoreductase (DUF2520 family)|nr:DUF2520 domain-containing protein [Flavobacteriales bacterium]